MNALIESLVNSLQNKISGELIVFIISLFPVLELRGGLIAATLLGIEWQRAFIFCFIGNMLPIPFILLFIRKIFELLRKTKSFGKVVDKLENKADKHRDKIDKYELWGLFLLVAIPLPGTGAWTGALVAALMDIRIRRALPVIAAGVIVAGIIVATISYGLAGIIK
ncbi:MAG: small multi-drug export protein [Clostridia bacterium]|nr:small multi-drug export protein [Clostridia bacterium]